MLASEAVLARSVCRDSRRELAVAARKDLEGKNQVNDVSPAMLSCMRESTAPVAEKFGATYDPAVVHLYPVSHRDQEGSH